MSPVLVKGEPEGFVFNRLQGALLREAYCLVRDGVISPADVDRVVKEGLGRRWAVFGPFETSHLNTRGGIRRHAELMGPAYERMGAERGQHDPWTPISSPRWPPTSKPAYRWTAGRSTSPAGTPRCCAEPHWASSRRRNCDRRTAARPWPG